MKKDVEIEIQVKVEKVNRLLKFLQKEAKLVAKKRQVDRYFTPAHRNFAEFRPINEWLRIRNSGGQYSLNYKNWHREEDGKSHFCDEYETTIGNVDSLEKIFKALEVNSLVTVDKKRHIWLYRNYEIAIDSVKNLGNFVEIEYKGEIQGVDPAKITQEMVDFLKKVGCGKITRNYQGYPFRLMFPKEARDEDQGE